MSIKLLMHKHHFMIFESPQLYINFRRQFVGFYDSLYSNVSPHWVTEGEIN